MKQETSKNTSGISKKVAQGLKHENYYYCELPEYEVSAEDLITILSSARWVNSYGEEPSKDERRAISLLSQFKHSATKEKGIVCAECYCYFNRETKTKTNKNLNLPERDIDIESIKLQLKPSEYKDFLESFDPVLATEMVMDPIVVKCENQTPDTKCVKCKGTGRVACEYCNGWGDHKCRDCNGSGELFSDEWDFSKDYFYHTKYGTPFEKGQLKKGYPKMECPSCNGTGNFRCKVCNGSGFIVCSSCNGSGQKMKVDSPQRITELIETYRLDMTCDLILSNGNGYALDSDLLKNEIVNSNPIFSRGDMEVDDMNSVISEIGRYSQITCSEYKKRLKDKDLFSMHVVTHELDDIQLISFVYDSEDYNFLIIDNQAFINSIPEVTFLEKLLGTYKKKI